MKSLWRITLEDYNEILKRSLAKGIKPGESMEAVLREYMKEKGKKLIGHTELSFDEMLKEQTSHGKKVLGIETKDGKTVFKKVKSTEEK